MPATFPRLSAGAVPSPLFTSSALNEVEAGSTPVTVLIVFRASPASEFDITGVASGSDAELVCPALVICDTTSAVLDCCMLVVEGAGTAGFGVAPLGDPAGIDGLAGCDSGGAGAVSPAPGLADSSSPPSSSSESESDMESPSSESMPSLSSDPESSSPSPASSPDSESVSSSFSSAS